MLADLCSVLCRGLDEELGFRSLTEGGHVEAHDAVTLLTASRSINDVLSTSDAAVNTDGSLHVANSLAHHLGISLCASSTNLPDKIFACLSQRQSSKCLL